MDQKNKKKDKIEFPMKANLNNTVKMFFWLTQF